MSDPITYGPEGTPYLAIDVQPDNQEGAFTLDVSELDGPDELVWLADLAWVNIVCDVTAAAGHTGATRHQGVLTRTEAGTVTVVATDWAGQLDPLANAENIHRGTPLRLRAWGSRPVLEGGVPVDEEAWTETLWTGQVDQVSAEYAPDGPPQVTITGMDLVAVLAGWSAAGHPDPGVGAGDNLRTRTQRVLNEAGVGAVAAASDAVFAATLNPSALSAGWDDISDAADAELGRVWVDRDGALVVRARGSELAGPVRGTLSDVHGETVGDGVHCCLTGASVVYGAEVLTNTVRAGRRQLDSETADPVMEVRTDTYSAARYGPGTAERMDLELATDAQLGPWAEALILAGATPELRVDSVVPSPAPGDLDSALQAWPAVCATTLGDRWVFRLSPYRGQRVERTVGVLGVDFELSPDGWTFTWLTVEAPEPGKGGLRGWFVLDASELDSGDVLAPYSQPLPG